MIKNNLSGVNEISYKQAEKYWSEYLDCYEGCATINSSFDEDNSDIDIAEYAIEFNKGIYERIKVFAQARDIEPYVLFNALWGFMLARYNNERDIIFGNVISQRLSRYSDDKIKVVPIRINCTEDTNVLNFLNKMQRSANLNILYSYFPMSDIEKLCTYKKDFLKIIIDFGAETEHREAIDYNLYLNVIFGEAFKLKFKFNKSKYTHKSIEGMVSHLEKIAEQIIDTPSLKTNEIELLSAEEIQALLTEYNSECISPTRNIVELFKKAVAKYPENIAVAMDGTKLTYMQLDRYSDEFAAYLVKKGVKKESLVAIFAERKIETIIGIVGILKAGGAYLPIDPDYPQSRIEYIANNARVDIIITVGSNHHKAPANICIIDLCDENSYIREAGFLQTDISPDSLAYVIYTSGTTGEPKGVMVEHKSVIRLVKDTNYISFEARDRILQTGSIVFDASTLEIWGSLLNGSTLYMCWKKDILDISKLKSILYEKEITVMFLTSSLFQHLAEEDITLFKNLRVLVVGGDVMSCKQAERVIGTYKSLDLINGYGPTENTTFSTCFSVDKPYKNSIPIGKPIANSTAYIINCFGNLQVPGMPGELLVGGIGVARGYLNNEELTKERFVSLACIPEKRLYRTGDIVKMMTDGNIQFIGRIDGQVKIRGFRIELNEIQNRLLSYEKINEALVSVYSNNESDKFICAFVTGNDVDCDVVREYLGKFLPAYMIPAHIINLEAFPLTINGKIDKEALKIPTSDTESIDEASANDLEKTICGIWKKLLGRNVISLEDNFFHIGGDSLKVMSFISEAGKKGFSLSFTDLYNYPSARELVSSGNMQLKKIPKIQDKENIRLSFAQEGIWFNSMIEPIYNVVLSVSLRREIDFDIFRQAVELVILENQELRTVIVENNYIPFQKIYNEVISDITVEKHLDKTDEELRRFFEHKETHRQYELDKAPLFHFRVGEGSDGSLILTIGTHHVLADAYTINIILASIDEKYGLLEKGIQPAINQNNITCADYAEWQRTQFEKGAYDADIQYWREKLNGDISLIEFPEKEDCKYGEFEGSGEKICIPEETMEKFKDLCKQSNISFFVAYTTAFYIFLNYIYDIEDIAIGTATAGRDRAEIQNTAGNFAYASLIRERVSKEDSFVKLALKIKKTLSEAYQHQGLPFEMILKESKVDRKYYKLPYRILIEYIENDKKTTNLGFSVPDYSNEITPADFTFFIQSETDAEYLHFYFKRKLFDEEEIKDFVYLMEDIMTEVVNNPDKPIEKYDI